jgi:hypothetical protein
VPTISTAAPVSSNTVSTILFRVFCCISTGRGSARLVQYGSRILIPLSLVVVANRARRVWGSRTQQRRPGRRRSCSGGRRWQGRFRDCREGSCEGEGARKGSRGQGQASEGLEPCDSEGGAQLVKERN